MNIFKNKNKFYPEENRRFSFRAFTLIELLVVIAIIGLLSSIVIVSLNKARVKARDARRVAELKQLEKALQIYYTGKGKYPNSITANPNDPDDTGDPGDPDCWGEWESGNSKANPGDPFIPALGITTPKEWTNIKDGWNTQCTYRYGRWTNPCNGCCSGTYAILYAACEGNNCPVNEKPACCLDSCGWGEGSSAWVPWDGKGPVDPRDYVIFLKE